MRDQKKTKAQLVSELADLRQRLSGVEGSVAGQVRRKRVKERRAAEVRYHDLYDNAPDMFVLVDPETTAIRECNQTLATAFGYTKEEIVGRPIFDLYHPDCMEDVQKAFRSFVETGEVRNAELQLKRKDGSKIDVLLNVSAVHDEQGKVRYSRSVLRDITERKKAEEKLRKANQALLNMMEDAEEARLKSERSEAEYRRLIHQAVYGIFRSSPEGRFLMVNPAMVRILGYDSEEELLALDSIEMVYADPSQRAGIVQRFIVTEEVERFPVQWIRKDGEGVSLVFSGRPVIDDSGEVVCLEFMVEDVTERRILEEQLHQAQRLEALGQLAGGVAHDFNNILSVIIIEAQLGMRRLGEDNPLRERFSEIKQAADRAAELTGQLLAFSRKQIVEPTVLSINRLISEMSTMLSRLLPEDIELSLELEETLGNVLADKGQLEQIMANLVVNARDAMPGGGQLTIRTLMMTPTVTFHRMHPGLQAEALVVLEIQDSGCGIPDEVKAKIFDPFFTTKGRGKGTGLGLATVYGIVQKMGGEIEVDSTVDVGTTMRIYLPLVEETETEEVAEDEVSRPGGSETVIVVEDDARLRRVAAQLLEENGYTVMSCEDGPDAIRRLESHDDPVHLILTDVIMPNMGGREVVGRLQELRPEIKVLFMSGYTDDEILERSVSTRGIAFLPKPFTAESLPLAVRNVLDQ